MNIFGFTKKRLEKGFTVLELVVILFIMIILIAIMLGNFKRAKSNVRNQTVVAQMQEIELALEQYRARCKVYPETIYTNLSPANNGYGNGVTCSASFTDFLPGSMSIDASTTRLHYRAYQPVSGSGVCATFHLAGELHDTESYLLEDPSDDDWKEGIGAVADYTCGNSGSPFNIGNVNDGNAFYDWYRPEQAQS